MTNPTLLFETPGPNGPVATYWVETARPAGIFWADVDADDEILVGHVVTISDDGTDAGDRVEGPAVYATREGRTWVAVEPIDRGFGLGLPATLEQAAEDAVFVASVDYRTRHDIGTCPECPAPRTVIDRVGGLCPAHHAARVEVAA